MLGLSGRGFRVFYRALFCICKTRHFGKKLGVGLGSLVAVKLYGSSVYDRVPQSAGAEFCKFRSGSFPRH
jgi:hypothetical protein